MSHLPRKKFQLASSGLRYTIYCHPSLPPCCQFGVAGDLYIQSDDNIVFYKEITTASRKGKWRLASDAYTIHHPSEFAHHLIVTADRYLQWSQNRVKAFSFKHAMSVMTTLILADRLTVPGDTPSNPIRIDLH